jgi:putative ABC transport system permease protein
MSTALVQLLRHRTRTLLTVLGTTCGLFLFITVDSFQNSLERSTTAQAGDDLLIVYRDKRYCPFTSRLPQDYERKIKQLQGVKSVVPVQVIVNHCGTSVDTITFRGLPSAAADAFFKNENLPETTISHWKHRSDAAIVGHDFATRRKLKLGDRFDAAGLTVSVAGIVKSQDPQMGNSLFVHLDFLQQASGRGLGEVTQFNVRVQDAQQMDSVAKAIDALFRSDREPTHTRPEKAFMAQTAKEMIQLVAFTRYLGLAAVLAVLLLMANTIAISVRGRVREHAVLQALGYQSEHLVWMVLCEGILLAALGGGLALAAAAAFLHWGEWSLSAEGLSLVFRLADINLHGVFLLAGLLGIVSGVVPALGMLRGSLVSKLRSA